VYKMPLLILEKYGEEALFSHTKVYHVGTYFVVGDLTINSIHNCCLMLFSTLCTE